MDPIECGDRVKADPRPGRLEGRAAASHFQGGAGHGDVAALPLPLHEQYCSRWCDPARAPGVPPVQVLPEEGDLHGRPVRCRIDEPPHPRIEHAVRDAVVQVDTGNAVLVSERLLQRNVLDRQRWETREELRLAIVTWIEKTYHRRHKRFGHLTPVEF